MAEVGLIYPQGQIKQLNEVTKGLKSNDEQINKTSQSIAAMDAVIKNSNASWDKIAKSIKAAEGISIKITQTTEKLKTSEEKLTALQKERIRIQEQQKQVLAKNLAVQEKSNTVLQKGRILLQQRNKQVKQDILLSKAQTGAYDKIAISLSKNIAKWKSLSASERENSKAGKQLTATIKQQDAQLKKLDSQIGRSQRHVGDYGRAIKGVASSLLGAFGVVGGIAMFARVMKDAFGTLRSFTKENAVLAGVLGKTREEIEDLTEQAIQLGSVYPVTASEVVKLQVSFARLGFTMAEIQDLTEATILGSIALNAELDATATLVGAVVKAYSSLGTSDAQMIIDQLTLSTQRSSLSFSGLETALPKVAAAASAMNVPLSKTLALLGIAQDATLDASVSGTSLRNIFLEIAKEGITLDEALLRINTSQNKLTAAYDLFGKRGAIVGLALADNIDKIGEFDEAIQDAGGTTESVAEVQMKTMDGAIKGLESSWEKAMLGFRESEGFLSDLFSGIAGILDRSTLKYVSNEEAFRIHQRNLNKTSNKTSLDVEQDYRDKLQGVRDVANQQELQEIARQHEFLLGENEVFDKDFLKAVEDRSKSLEKEQKDSIAKSNKTINDEALVKLELERESADKIAKERKKAEDKANKEIEDARQKHFEQLRKSNEKFVEDSNKQQRLRVHEEIKAGQELTKKQGLETDKLKDRNKKVAEGQEEAIKEEIDAEALKEETIIAAKVAGIDAAEMILQNAAFKKSDRIQTEIDELNAQRTEELANENLTQEQRAAIEAKFDKKEAVLKTKKAKADKKAAITSSIINIASGILKTIATLGFPAAIPAIVALGITGAAQTAIIAAQPLPQFFGGTDNAPGTGFIAGDKKGGGAARELMTLSTGQMMMVDKPTYFEGNRFKGATINTNAETEKILRQSEQNNSFVFDTKAIERNNRKQTDRLLRGINRLEQRQNKRVSNDYKQKHL